MLYQAKDTQQALREPVVSDGYRLLLEMHLRRLEPEIPVSVLVDRQPEPEVLILRMGLSHILLAPHARYVEVFRDLFTANIDQPEPWPTDYVRQEWAKEPGRPRILLTACPASARDAAVEAGFVLDPDEHHNPHFFYCTTGEPRFAEHVKHPCRLGDGMELYDMLRAGIDYDESGEYTRQCLEQGPSFCCEVDGTVVCCSCTHLGGTMGMIYTPPEHRGHGYGRSLAAFQIDYMLRTKGAAYCHVNEKNGPSFGNLDRIGMPRLPEALTWRILYFPDGMYTV